ncbi:MAG: protein tyrosine phosphatase [Verrucomicrobia bacterium RIFCSPHIGHO2_12_FULL_41_10]|nr:MAG: protein tyrosine phosphatase [Verrucomicrobia bacterium RIFCSPHIGHO2_12_FULL_41_10]
MIKNILVICIGNICRSPMGEALFKNQLINSQPNLQVHSAGLQAMVGYPADPFSQELMQLKGLDISSHRAQQATPELLFNAELILTMCSNQQVQIEKNYPGTRGRVHRLGKWEGFDIPDPYKRPRIVFEQTLALIEQGINDWYRKLWN